MKLWPLLLAWLIGCVPIPIYQENQKKVSALQAQLNLARKRLEECEGQNKNLKSQPKPSPVKIVIEQDELNEIKKKSLEEAERKSKSKNQPKRD